MDALAWDDEPLGYIKNLAGHLKRLGIDVTICDDEDQFIHALHDPTKKWDFVITDLVKANSPAFLEDDPRIGAGIAQHVKDIPVFLVTQHYSRFDPEKLGIPSHVVMRSKSTHPGWQAADIRDELRRRGMFTGRNKVFLIYGHDRNTPGATRAVEEHLSFLGVEVVKIKPENLFSEIANGLVERMHDCGAIVAVCTPDDLVEDDQGKYYQPRQNVLMEIGVALGLARGMKRLTILQKYGAKPDEMARLPSDLGGVVPIRFDVGVEEKFDELESRLRKLGVKFSKRPGS